MLLKAMCVAVLLVAPLLAQTGGGLPERIRSAPLSADEREAVAASFSQKAFDRLETVLSGAVRPDTPRDRASARRALLGALEFAGGRTSRAIEAFRQADALSPLDDRDRFTLAMALIDIGDPGASRTHLARLNELHPKQGLYLYWLGRLDYDQRLYDAAVDKFKRVIALDPNSARAYDNLGLTYDMLGRTEDARAAFTKATELNRKLPKPSPWPPDNLGYFLSRQQEFDPAEENLREALKYDPKFALAHYHLARVLESKKRNDEAIEEYKSAAALDSTLALPLYSLGLLYRKVGKEAESAAALAEYKRRRALLGDTQ